MKSSDMEQAQKLITNRLFYRDMMDMLSSYPGFDAKLVVNGKSLMIGRVEAIAIIERYQETNVKDMENIGLEFDE